MATSGTPAPIGGPQSGTFGLISKASGTFGVSVPGRGPSPNQSGTFGLQAHPYSGTFGLQPHPYSGDFGLRANRSGTFGTRFNLSGTFGLQVHPYSGEFGLRQGQSGTFGVRLGDRSGSFGLRLPTYSGVFGLSTNQDGILIGVVTPPTSALACGGPTYPPPPSVNYYGQGVSYRLGNKRFCTISGSLGGDFMQKTGPPIFIGGPSSGLLEGKWCELSADIDVFQVVFSPISFVAEDYSFVVGSIIVLINVPYDLRTGASYAFSANLTTPVRDADFDLSGSGDFTFSYSTELWVTVEAPYGNPGYTEIREYICPDSDITYSANFGAASVSGSVHVIPNISNSPRFLTQAPTSCLLKAVAHHGPFAQPGVASAYVNVGSLPFHVIPQDYTGVLHGSVAVANDVQGDVDISSQSVSAKVTDLSTPPVSGTETHEVHCGASVEASPLWEYAVHVALRTPTNAYPDTWQARLNTDVPAQAPPPFAVTNGKGSYQGHMTKNYGLGGYLARYAGVYSGEEFFAQPDSAYSESHNGNLSTLSLTLIDPDAQAAQDVSTNPPTLALDWQGWQWDAVLFGQTESVWVDKTPIKANWTPSGGATLADSSGGLVITGAGSISSACPLPVSPDPALLDVYAGLDFRGYSTLRLYLTVPSGQTARASVSMFCLLDNEAAAYFGVIGTTTGPLTATKTWNVTVKDVATQPYIDIDLLCPSNNTASVDDEHLLRIDTGDTVVTILLHRADMLFGITNNPESLQIGVTDAQPYTLKQIQLIRPQNNTTQRELGGYSTLDLPTISLPIGVSGSLPQAQLFTDTSGKRNIFNVQNSDRALEICDFWPAPPSFIPNYTRRGFSYLNQHPYSGLFKYETFPGQTGHTVPLDPGLRDGLLHNSQSDFCLGGGGWLFDLNKVDGSGKGSYDLDIAVTGGFSQCAPQGKILKGQLAIPVLVYFPPGVGNVWNESYAGTVFPLLAAAVLRTQNKGYVFDTAGARAGGETITVKSSPGGTVLGAAATTNARGFYFVDSSHPFARADTVSRGGAISPAVDRYLRFRRWTNFAVPVAGAKQPTYDVGAAGRHVRAYVRGGNVWIGLAGGPVPSSGSSAFGTSDFMDADTSLAETWPTVRWEKRAARPRLWLASIGSASGAGPVHLRYSSDEGATWSMATLNATGTEDTLVETAHGLKYIYYRQSDGSIKGQIMDAQNNLLPVHPGAPNPYEFVAVPSGADDTGIDADEFSIGGGEWRIGLLYISAGVPTYVSAKDGMSFS